MRISADSKDPGYREDCTGYVVFCNGARLRDCVTADEEQGLAICFVRNAEGHIVGDLVTGEAERREFRGKIKVERGS